MLSVTYVPLMLSVTFKPFLLSITCELFMLSVTYEPFMLSILNALMLSVVMLEFNGAVMNTVHDPWGIFTLN
jgi:hypothetical protein